MANQKKGGFYILTMMGAGTGKPNHQRLYFLFIFLVCVSLFILTLPVHRGNNSNNTRTNFVTLIFLSSFLFEANKPDFEIPKCPFSYYVFLLSLSLLII